MALKNFNIPKPPNPAGQAELILKSAGLGLIKPKFFRVDENEIAKEQAGSDVSVFATGTSSSSHKSKFGLPTFDAFAFNASTVEKLTYKASQEFGGGDVVITAPFVFETCLITVNQTKNIVKTAIAGKDGTVKEYMSQGDFQLNLKGVIVEPVANSRVSMQTVDALVAYLNAPLSLPITCDFLDSFKINSVVVESWNIEQKEGTRNVFAIDINMISDSVIELSSSGGSKPQF